MKKLISLLLAMLICASFAACTKKHECEMKWTFDDEYHWKKCDGCDETSDREEHSMGEWEPLDGDSRVRECEKCGAKQEEEIDPEAIWNASFGIDKLENVTVAMTVSGLEFELEQNTVYYKFDGELIDENGRVYEAEYTRELFQQIIASFMADFDKFEKDEDGVYNAKEPISFELEVAEYTATVTGEDLAISFDKDGNLAKLSCFMIQDILNERTLSFDFSFDFSDYGTTVVEEK